MQTETKRQRFEYLHASLKKERQSWEPYWRDLSDFILPRRSRFLTNQRNRGDKRNQKIINNVGTMAARTLKSGMHSGITSPARPWFRLTTPDPDMAEYGPVKDWLYQVIQRMQTVFARSNIYNTLPIIYGDAGTFGTAAAGIFDDTRDLMRSYTYPVGSYAIACNDRGVVDTWVRQFSMTARQMVDKFGEDNVSKAVKNLYDTHKREEWVDVVHVIKPNDEFDPNKLNAKYKAFSSCYYEIGADGDQFLRESGFDEFPMLCPRWETTGEDVYGYSPGMDALGDIKALQTMEKRGSQALAKQVNPPMIGDPSLKTQKTSLLPGDITYVSSTQGVSGFRAAHEVNFRLDSLEYSINKHEERINSAFFADLFLMLAMSDRRQITATEVAERHEEKLLMLGPVLERLNDELLDPLIDRVFNMMARNGMLPPAPPELEGIGLKVEHISILAQAQKMVSVGSTERFMGFVGNLASVNQNVLDKVDMDQAVDEYGDAMGVPPNLIRSDDDVAAIREQRAQQLAAQRQAEQAQAAAQGAKTLSETDLESDSALSRIIQQTTGATS